MRSAALAVVLVAALAGCRGGTEAAGDPPAPVSRPTGATQPASPATRAATHDLCGLLTPADFRTVAGLTVPAPTANHDSPDDAYCVYGPLRTGPEVDVFVTSSVEDASGVYQTVQAEGPVDVEADDVVPEADESAYVRIDSVNDVGVDLRRGKLVAAISVPNTVPDARAKLVALAQLLLKRAESLSSE